MLNQMLSIFFGNRTDQNTENSGLQAQQSKKRLNSDLGRNDHRGVVKRKRGRPPLNGISNTSIKFKHRSSSKQQILATSNYRKQKVGDKYNPLSYSEEYESSSDSDYTDCENDISSSSDRNRKRTRSGDTKIHSSNYPQRDRRTVLEKSHSMNREKSLPISQNHSNSRIYLNSSANDSNNSLAAVSNLSSAQMRRSRRSKVVDLSKELIIILPHEDPQTMPQLDIRSEVEWDEFCVAMSEEHLYSDNEEDVGHGRHALPSNLSLVRSSYSSSNNTNERLWNTSFTSKSRSPIVGSGSNVNSHEAINSVPCDVCIPDVRDSESYKILSILESFFFTRSEKSKRRKQTHNIPAISKEDLSKPLMDRWKNGYDCNDLNSYDSIRSHYEQQAANPMPQHNSSVYIDYDADSDDEEFVVNLQKIISNNKTAKINKSKSSGICSIIQQPEFKLRCFEVLICRLERHLELSRYFHSRQESSNSNVLLNQLKKTVDESKKTLNFSRNFLKRILHKQNKMSSINTKKASIEDKFDEYKPIKEMLSSQPMASISNTSTTTSNYLSALSTVVPRQIGRPPKHQKNNKQQLPLVIIPSNEDEFKDNKEKKTGSTNNCLDNIVNSTEILTKDCIMDLVPLDFVLPYLQNILQSFLKKYQEFSSNVVDNTQRHTSNIEQDGKKKKKDTSLGEVKESSQSDIIQFSEQQELMILNEVYNYWVDKRCKCSTSLIRGYHSYMMDLWCRAEDIVLPEPFDFDKESLKAVHTQLTAIRKSLDRTRLITDRVRRREKVKRDLIRNSSEQLDLVLKRSEKQDSKLIVSVEETINTLSSLRSRNVINIASTSAKPKVNKVQQAKIAEAKAGHVLKNAVAMNKFNKVLDDPVFSIGAIDYSSDSSQTKSSISKKNASLNESDRYSSSKVYMQSLDDVSDDESPCASLSSYESEEEESVDSSSNNITTMNKSKNATTFNSTEKKNISNTNSNIHNIPMKMRMIEKDKLAENNRNNNSLETKKQLVNINNNSLNQQNVGISPVLSIGSNSTRSTRSHSSVKNNSQLIISSLSLPTVNSSLRSNTALAIDSMSPLNDISSYINSSSRGSRSRLSKIPDCSLRNLPSTTSIYSNNNYIIATTSASSKKMK